MSLRRDADELPKELDRIIPAAFGRVEDAAPNLGLEGHR